MSLMKVKTILVSQPEPKVENSPYFELQQKHKVKIDFRPYMLKVSALKTSGSRK